MVRLRPSSSERNDNVFLYVVGPKAIIPESVAVQTKLSNTWLNLLNDELDLGVTVDKGYYVCSSGYCPTAPKDGEGWRSELTEPIKDYINKFERKRKQYRVRISFAYDVGDNQGTSSGQPQTPKKKVSTPATRSKRGRSPENSVSPSRRPNIVISTDRGNTSVQSSFSAGNNLPSSSSSTALRSGCQITKPQSQALNILKDKRVGSSSTLSKANGKLDGVAKRPGMQNYTEVHIQTNIPSVPGPHVFVSEETRNSIQTLRIDDFRSVVKTECMTNYYDELDEDLDDEFEYEDEEEEGEGENTTEQKTRNEGDRQDEQEKRNEEEEFGRMSDEENNVQDELNDMEENEDVKELRQLDIRFEDIKSSVDRRFSGFSNAYMLRVRNEMRTLMKNKEWMDVFQRSPLAFYFIQEMFKD